MLTLSEGDKSYLAGLIDGEGCIFIAKHNPKGHASPVYNLQLIVSMTDEPVVRRCKQMTGVGFITITDRPQGNPNYRVYYRWTVNKKDAYSLLTQIKDLFTVKRGQAETAIEFVRLGIERSGRYGQVSENINKRREELRLKLMDQKKAKPREAPIEAQNTTENAEKQLSLF